MEALVVHTLQLLIHVREELSAHLSKRKQGMGLFMTSLFS